MDKLIAIALVTLGLAACASQGGQVDVGVLSTGQARATCSKYKQDKMTVWAQCYEDEVRKGYARQNAAVPDDANLVLLKLKALAPKVDNGEMSEAECLFEVNALSNQLNKQQQIITNSRPPPEPFVYQRPQTCFTNHRGTTCR